MILSSLPRGKHVTSFLGILPEIVLSMCYICQGVWVLFSEAQREAYEIHCFVLLPTFSFFILTFMGIAPYQ